MGIFDKIKKSVSETVSDISTRAEQTFNEAKTQASEVTAKVGAMTSETAKKIGDCTVGLVSSGAKSIGEGISYLGDAVTEAGDGDYTKVKSMTLATGDFIAEAVKDMTGINAYKHYQAAKIDSAEAEAIAHRVEDEVAKVRYLANDRLHYMGIVRMDALKNTVGRFISLLERINQRVKDKEYEMFTQIDITEGDLKEMEIVVLNHKKASSTIAVGIAAASGASIAAKKLALYGVQKLAFASTGTAIKNLHGAAAQKATLAWIGGKGGMALGAERLASIGKISSGIVILTTAATVASMYYSQQHTAATRHLADVKIWEAKTLAACELMKRIVRRSDEIATLTTRLETRSTDALDLLEKIVDNFDSSNPDHVNIFQKSALLVKSTSQLCQTPLIDQNGELNTDLDAVTLSSEKVLNKKL